MAPLPRQLLGPGGQRRADAASAVLGVDGGVSAPVVPYLRVGHQAVPVEDPDGAGRHVEAGSLPVRDDVGFLDLDRADVVLLLGGHHLEHRAGVLGRQGPGDEISGQLHGQK